MLSTWSNRTSFFFCITFTQHAAPVRMTRAKYTHPLIPTPSSL